MRRLTRRRYVIALAALAFASGAALAAALEMGPLDAGLFRPGGARLALAVRGPRVVLGALVGASLSTAGVAFQALLKNPLADPFILGVSGGAAAGAALAMVVGAPAPLVAFAGALGATVLVWALARRAAGPETERLLLTGVVVNAFLSALILLFSYLAPPGQKLEILQWMSGNLAGGGRLGALAAALAAAFPVFFALARDLDLVSLGDRAATDLGVDLRRTRAALFFSGSLVTGAAVASSGLIGFVGLIVPHALRLLLGPDHRLLVPAALFGGAGFLALADGAARSVLTPEDLPVGVLTALAGGPFFVWLLLRPGPRERRSGHGRTLREALAEPPPAVPISARAPPLNAPSRPSARAAGHGNPATRARPAIGRPEEEPRGTLSARAVACSYGVRGLDLELRPGELLALFGPNGAGKSTLLRLFSGEIVPEAGCVDLGGRPLRALSRREIARLFATVPQEPIPALPYTVGEVVLMGRAPRVRRFRLEADPDVRAAEAAIEALGIAALGDRPVAEISGGERQRVAIARALAQNAPYLLLDEPTAFLDVRHQVEVFRLLRALAHEGGRAVLVASHEVNLAAQYADRVALLDRGALCAVGPPEEVLRPETLEAVFGAAVDLARHGRTGRPYFVFGGE